MGAQGTLATCIALLFHHHVATCNAHLLCVPPPGPRGGSRCREAATASIHGSRRSANSTGCSPSSTWCRRCAGCCRCCCGRCTRTPRVRPKHLPTQGQPAVREGSLRGLLQQDADAIVWAHECATRYALRSLLQVQAVPVVSSLFATQLGRSRRSGPHPSTPCSRRLPLLLLHRRLGPILRNSSRRSGAAQAEHYIYIVSIAISRTAGHTPTQSHHASIVLCSGCGLRPLLAARV